MPTLTDAEIIESSESDPGRFEAIFVRHFGTIHRYLHRRVGRELADDLASETFLVAFRSRHGYDRTRDDARPWLFGISTNLVRHHRRTERRKLVAYARTGVDPLGAPDPALDAVEDRALAAAEGPALAAALAALRAPDRDVLLLYAWADLGYRQIAEGLGIPIGTVRSRLARARRRLRELLGASGQSHEWRSEPVPGGIVRRERR